MNKPTLPPNEKELKRLLDNLHFEEAQAVHAAASQASLFFEACKVQTHAMKQRMVAQRNLEILKATLLLRARNESLGRGEKIGQKILDAMVLSDPEFLTAHRRLEKAEEYEATAKLLVEAYRQRREALRIVGDQNRAEFGAIRSMSSVDVSGLRKQLMKKYPGMEVDGDD